MVRVLGPGRGRGKRHPVALASAISRRHWGAECAHGFAPATSPSPSPDASSTASDPTTRSGEPAKPAPGDPPRPHPPSQPQQASHTDHEARGTSRLVAPHTLSCEATRTLTPSVYKEYGISFLPPPDLRRCRIQTSKVASCDSRATVMSIYVHLCRATTSWPSGNALGTFMRPARLLLRRYGTCPARPRRCAQTGDLASDRRARRGRHTGVHGRRTA
jgi:hypothetical protein